MKKKEAVSHQDVVEAVQQFIREGGMIAKLPEQKQVRADYVGNDRYDTYEPLSTFSSNSPSQ